ncbi:uncharacterized protein BJ171DRAFT_82725 [Polychytrium aggregatum]|uniref:uncharacterized protein n=1 Tax=Polychytrium aggregatum TaxID=110093 RepID=UPI0022FDFFF1|nr:uncharacterized protein BJ171DRAFT_82725 [Polychytrium aggregatum]KAI9205079.1 hypothetical protein BJ171DRAFT_82725 [Polychytrium aggregatum]
MASQPTSAPDGDRVLEASRWPKPFQLVKQPTMISSTNAASAVLALLMLAQTGTTQAALPSPSPNSTFDVYHNIIKWVLITLGGFLGLLMIVLLMLVAINYLRNNKESLSARRFSSMWEKHQAELHERLEKREELLKAYMDEYIAKHEALASKTRPRSIRGHARAVPLALEP